MALPPIEIKFTADTKGGEVGIDRIKRAMKEADAAAEEYKLALASVSRAEKAGALTATQAAKAVKQAEAAYKKSAAAAASYIGATAKVTKAQNASAATSKLNSNGLRNVALQLNQVGQQSAVTGDFLGALAIQLPDLFAGFGGLKLAIGGAAVALAVALGPALFQALGASRSLEAQLEALGDTISNIDDQIDNLTSTADVLSKGFDRISAERLSLALLKAQVTVIDTTQALQENRGSIDELAARYTDLFKATQNAGQEQNALNNALKKINKELGLTGDVAKDFFDSLVAFQTAKTFEQQRIEAKKFADILLNSAKLGGNLRKEIRDNILEVVNLVTKAGLAEEAMRALNDLAISLEGNLGGAATQAENIARALFREGEIIDTSPMQGPEISSAPGRSPAPRGRPSSIGFGGSTGRGGKSEEQIAAERLDRSIKQLEERLNRETSTEMELLAERFQKRMDLINEAQEKERIGDAEANELKLLAEQSFFNSKNEIFRKYVQDAIQIAQEEADRLASIDEQKKQARKSFLSSMLALTSGSSKKLFNIVKAASIANAVVEGYESAVSAYNKGMKVGGPPVAALFAATSLARTGALIKSISSTSFGGGGGGAGGGGGGAGGAAEAAPAVSRNVAIQLSGGDVFSRDQVVGLINQINEAVEDGAVVRLA